MRKSVFCFHLMMLGALRLSAQHPLEKHTLAQATCSTAVGEARYLLTQEKIDEESFWKERAVIFRLERMQRSTEEQRELIWQNETAYSARAFPWPYWCSSLVCEPALGGVYLILVYNMGISYLSLDLFFLSATAPAITNGPTVSLTKMPQIPKLREKSLANYTGRLPFDGDGLKSVESTLTDGHLKVVIFQRNEKIAPLRFDIDLETKEIRRIQEDPRP